MNGELWFVAVTQALYGDEAVGIVDAHAAEVAAALDAAEGIPVSVRYAGLGHTPEGIRRVCAEAGAAADAGKAR